MPGRKDGRVRPADYPEYCQGLGGLLPQQAAAQHGEGWADALGRGVHFSLRTSTFSGGFQVPLETKNPPANAGDVGLTPGSGRCPGEGMATHSSTPA